MSSTISPSAEAKSTGTNNAIPGGKDRRRRKRAKISAQVHVRGGAGTAEQFEEVTTSIDVSRDGLLFTTSRPGYWVGQPLEVTFPYSTAAAAINTPQKAKVVRTTDPGNKKFCVAIEFHAAATEAKGAGAAVAAGAQAMVLIVESDARMGATMANLLQQDGYQVVVVASAQQGLEILRTATPVAVLAEVENEEMSGHDLCLIIKRNERLQHVPVILLTKSAQPADYSASHSFGAVVCMAKPFKPERLQHVVRLVAPPPSNRSAYGAIKSSGIERTL